MSGLLEAIVDQLIERFGAHETTQALLNNRVWQEHVLESRKEDVAFWKFVHEWRTESSTWRQTWVVAPQPEPVVFGMSDLQRPVG